MPQSRKTVSGQSNLHLIAEDAGVSIMTVSRALRGVNGVSPVTRERVLELARKHDYTRNMLVSGIRTGRTRTIGVMMPVASHFYSEILAGIHEALLRQNYAMLLSNLPVDFSRPGEASDERHLTALIERRVDGLIFRPTDDEATDIQFQGIKRRRIPFVTVDRLLAAAHCDFVGTDDYGGAVQAARHLLDLGHVDLVHIAGPSVVSTGRQRRRGFEDTVAAAGARCTVVECPPSGEEEALARFFALEPRPTAVFCWNDPTALRLYAAARMRGVRIPEDLSVVGFADLPEASYLWPRLTTVRQDRLAIGRRAGEVLLERIKQAGSSAPPEMIQLAPSLVIRESTAAKKS